MNFPPPTPTQARLLWASLTAVAFGVLVTLVVVLLWAVGLVLQRLSSVLLPLAIAGIVAYLLDPLVDRLERRGLPRARAIICVFALFTVTVGALIGSVVPQIVNETRQLTLRIPDYVRNVQQKVETWINHPPPRVSKWFDLSILTGRTNAPPAEARDPLDVELAPVPQTNSATNAHDRIAIFKAFDPAALQSATAWLASTLPKVGSWIFGQVTRVASWFGVLAGLILIPVYAFYLLLEKRGIERNWTDYLPVANSKLKNEIVFVLGSMNDCLITFFRGQVLVAICDGILYTIGFFSIGLPYAFLLGAMATILTMVPFLGAIITCITALIIAFVQFGDWLHPALVLGVFAVVQTLEGLVISPKIMGDRVGLHPLTIILAVMIGTTLMGGIVGGILAIPLTAALRAVMFRYIWRVRETSPFSSSRDSLTADF